jgi:hypothetical protein
VEDIEASKEYHTDLVEGMYEKFLNRQAGPAGLQVFVNMLGSGGTIEQVESIILGSPEFYKLSGGTVQEFVDALYRDLLGRALDPTGGKIWPQYIIQGQTRQQVAANVLASEEYLQDLVNGYYLEFLYRQADTFGLNAFVEALQQGTPDQNVIADILASGESYSRIQ